MKFTSDALPGGLCLPSGRGVEEVHVGVGLHLGQISKVSNWEIMPFLHFHIFSTCLMLSCLFMEKALLFCWDCLSCSKNESPTPEPPTGLEGWREEKKRELAQL